MTLEDQIKSATPEIVKKYALRNNTKASIQILNTLIPYFVLFYLALQSSGISYGLTAIFILLLSLFTLRIFILMHDCGHKSLFRTQPLNTLFGFFTGVLVGMPQYVWSQHHNFHHSTNGNWDKYRGPLSIITVDEYEKLSSTRQRKYRNARSIIIAPVGAFMYFIFNPRVNWIRGSLEFIGNVLAKKIQHPQEPLKRLVVTQKSRYWCSAKAYLHMTLNNIVLLGAWAAAGWYFGVVPFFTVFMISLSLAGAAGIILFTAQHNFTDSYASDDAHWNYHTAALKGTSFLIFPKIVNWFCADISYHHIHHMSAAIPNYNLARCHREFAYLFESVKRIKLRDIPKEVKCILWDRKSRRIISIDQYEQIHAAT